MFFSFINNKITQNLKYEPTKNLPTINKVALFADTMQTQLIRYGIAKDIVVYLRPILSASMPPGKAPKNAPIARNDPIHGSVNKCNMQF